MEGSTDRQSSKSLSFIAGRQPVVAALESDRVIDKILLQDNSMGEVVAKIRQLAKDRRIPVQMVPPAKLNTYTKINHQGCIALIAAVKYMDLQQVIDQVVSEGAAPLFVMLDGITDVRNIG